MMQSTPLLNSNNYQIDSWLLKAQESDPLNPEFQLGGVLLDKYRLDSVLGEGSFAVVFSASTVPKTFARFSTSANPAISAPTKSAPVKTARKVAVKCLYKTGLSRTQLQLQREEAVLLKRVSSHPNITTLLDVCENKHHLYLILEYCEMDLFDRIIKSSFSPEKALMLFEELVNAVASCHEVGIYHRDLKPENVLLSSIADPHIRLTDFGLATTDLLSTEYGCGSVRYMSPECFAMFQPSQKAGDSKFEAKTVKGTPYFSAANDVWSLAIILINMLTGKNPWVEPSLEDKHFRCHLINEQSEIDSFKIHFNFSDGFCQVLRLVFSATPEERLSARQFLAHVKRLPSIFATDAKKPPVKFTSIAATKPISSTAMASPSSFTGVSCNTKTAINVTNQKVFYQPLVFPPTPDLEEGPGGAVVWSKLVTNFDQNMTADSSSPPVTAASCSVRDDLIFNMEIDDDQ